MMFYKTKKEGKIQCNVCGKWFTPTDRYTVTDSVAPLVSLTTTATTYDAFDCEFCGCQNVVGERKKEVSVHPDFEEKEYGEITTTR